MPSDDDRPIPVVVLILIFLFAFGTIMSLLGAATLLFPNSALDAIWRLNPRGHEGFQQMGNYSFLVLGVIAAACCFCFVGLWRRKLWGYWCALLLISINFVADLFNGIIAKEYRALIGVPIALTILWALSRPKTRAYFAVKE